MGVIYQMKCNDCEEFFEVSTGGGADFYLLHCDVCGKERRVLITEVTQKMMSGEIVADSLNERIEMVAGSCEVCNGTYKINAPARCPKCHSTDLSEVSKMGNVTRAHFD